MKAFERRKRARLFSSEDVHHYTEYNKKDMEIKVESERELRAFGARLGAVLSGGEIIELIGDVGAGKTTLVKAIATGMGITDAVGSPSYTLSQTYEAPHGLRLAHYDFYRLGSPGILASELAEILTDQKTVVAIEWADIVADILPPDHLRISIVPASEMARQLTVAAGGDVSSGVLEKLL